MLRRSRLLVTLLASLAGLSLILVVPSASALTPPPNPPGVVRVGVPDLSIPTHPQSYRVSPHEGDTGFTVSGYQIQTTTNPSDQALTESAGSVGADGLGSVATGHTDPSTTIYVQAKMDAILADGSHYTTDWGLWSPIYGPAAPDPGPAPNPAPGPAPGPPPQPNPDPNPGSNPGDGGQGQNPGPIPAPEPGPVPDPGPPSDQPPSADGKQHGKVTGVHWSVGSNTPLYKLDVTVDSVAVTCPATVIIALGEWQKRSDLCAAGDAAPAQYHVLWKVFDGNHALPVNGSVSVTARVAKSDAPVYGGSSMMLRVPPAPVWVGMGDGFSSGQRQGRDNDPGFSWTSRAVDKLNANAPKQWRFKTVLLAQSDATTQAIGQSQTGAMRKALSDSSGSWNIVSLTGGASDIGLPGVLRDYFAAHPDGKPWAATKASDCPDMSALYSRLASQQSSISHGLLQIVAAGRAASLSTRFVDMLYPLIMAANSVCSSGPQGAKGVIDGLDQAHTILSGPDIIPVDLREEFGNNPVPKLQQTRNGYPYPNDTGQSKMANAAVAALR